MLYYFYHISSLRYWVSSFISSITFGTGTDRDINLITPSPCCGPTLCQTERDPSARPAETSQTLHPLMKNKELKMQRETSAADGFLWKKERRISTSTVTQKQRRLVCVFDIYIQIFYSITGNLMQDKTVSLHLDTITRTNVGSGRFCKRYMHTE